jgi:hypothetical protein
MRRWNYIVGEAGSTMAMVVEELGQDALIRLALKKASR